MRGDKMKNRSWLYRGVGYGIIRWHGSKLEHFREKGEGKIHNWRWSIKRTLNTRPRGYEERERKYTQWSTGTASFSEKTQGYFEQDEKWDVQSHVWAYWGIWRWCTRNSPEHNGQVLGTVKSWKRGTKQEMC